MSTIDTVTVFADPETPGYGDTIFILLVGGIVFLASLILSLS